SGRLPGLGSLPGSSSASNGNQAQASSSSVAKAEAAVVDIDTSLTNGSTSTPAAGTGMILTSSGEVLTNNHVIPGATSSRVTLPSTGRTYDARVLGTDPSADVALLKMQGAS